MASLFAENVLPWVVSEKLRKEPEAQVERGDGI